MPSDSSYIQYFQRLLDAQLSSSGLAWLQKQLANLQTEKDFYLAFSMAPRFTGKKPLTLSADDVQEAQRLRTGFNPSHWTIDQAARIVLLLSVPHASPEAYVAMLNKVFSTADLHELATLYASLPVLPYSESHVKRAAEGVRTTITDVFDAIALNNPYPHDYLPEEAWNQMVLKSIFNVRPLYHIYGIDNRRNKALATIAIDYAHERWAAGRTLTPELWRLVGPFITTGNIKDIVRLLQSTETIQQRAGILALMESDLPEAKELLGQYPEIEKDIQENQITWQAIGEIAYS